MLWHDDAQAAGYNLLKLARNCYHRLCPHCPTDLPVEKSSTMQAYIQGAMVHGGHLDQERDTWHNLHNALNNEIKAYKTFLNSLFPDEDGEQIDDEDAMKLISNFIHSKDRL